MITIKRKVWLQYIVVFLLAMLGTAFFTVITFKEPTVSVSATGKVIENILSAKDAKASFDLAYSDDVTKVEGSGELTLVIDEETSNISFSFNLDLTINETPISAQISFTKGVAYVKYNDSNLKFDVDFLISNFEDMMSFISLILEQVELPFDTSSISTSSLQGLISGATEEETENGYLVMFPLSSLMDILPNIYIQANENYQPVHIYTDTNETNLFFEAITDFESKNEPITPSDEQKEYTDISKTFELLTLLKTFSNETFALDLNILSPLEANLQAKMSLNPLMVQFNANAYGQNALVTFKDNEFFVDILGAKLKTDLDYLTGLIDFDVDLGSLLPATDILDLIANFDISSISLDKYITITEENGFKNFNISIDDFLLVLITQNGVIDSIELFTQETQIFEANVITENITFEEIDTAKYYDASLVIDKLDIIKEIIEKKKVCGQIEFTAGDITVTADILADFSNGIKAQASFNLFDMPAVITFIDDIVYLELNNIKLSASIEDMEILAGQISQVVGTDFSQILESIKTTIYDKASEIFDETKPILLEDFFVDENAISFAFSGISFDFDFSQDLAVKITTEKLSFDASLKAIDNAEIKVNGTYQNIKSLETLLNLAKNALRTQSATFSLNYENLALNGKLDFSNGIYAEIETSLFGKTLKVIYENENIYLNYDGVFVRTTITEIKEILSSFDVNLDFDSITASLGENELIKNILSIADSQEMENILNSVVTILKQIETLTFDETKLTLEIANLLLNAELTDSTASGSIQYDEYLINFGIEVKEFEKTNIEEQNYISLSEVVNVAQNMKDYISKGQFGFEASITINGQIFEVPIYLDINKKALFAKTTFEDLNISLTFVDNTIYVQVEDILVEASFENVKEVLNIVSQYVEIDTQVVNEIIDKVISILNNPESALDMLELPEITLESVLSIISNDLDFDICLTKQDNELTLSGRYAEHNFAVLLENNSINQIKYNGIINATLDVIDFVSISAPTGNIIKASNLIKLYNAVVNMLDGAISGTGQLSFTLLDEQNTIDINYALNLKDGIEAQISTTFKGINISATVKNDTIYLDIAGMKIYLAISEIQDLITYLETTFNLSLGDSLENLTSALEISSSIKDILNTDLEKLEVTENTANIIFKGIDLSINFDETLENIALEFGDISASLNCNVEQNFDLNLNANEFKHYQKVLNLINILLDTFDSKQFNINAQANVFRGDKESYSGNMNLSLDMTNEFILSGSGILNGETDSYNVKLNVENDYIYIDFNNLKLKASKQSLKEILIIALQALGIDPSSIKILGVIDDDMNFNTDNISQIIPSFDLGNPLNMLQIIKSLGLKENSLTLVLDGKQISQEGKDMTVSINFDATKIVSISLQNIFTGVSEDEYFDLVLSFDEFNGVNKVVDEGFIDISNSSEILKALVNTTSLNDYHITGTITVDMKLIGILNFSMDIPVDAQIKIDENGSVSAVINFPDIPVIGSNVPGFTGINVNNDVPYVDMDMTVKDRKMTVYILDKYIYFDRYDTLNKFPSGTRDFHKTLKISLNDLMADPLYYLLQFGFGFSDTIMNEIEKAMEKATNRETPIDIGNVLLGYTNEGNHSHNIIINLEELSNNSQLESASIDIITTEKTNNNDFYLYQMLFDIYMPLATGVEMNLKTTDLTLNDIGQTVDTSSAFAFADSYEFNENAEMGYYENTWHNLDQTNYGIFFEENGGNEVLDQSALVGTEIILPTDITKSPFDDGTVLITYSFAGWYLSADFEGEPVTSIMTPKRDTSLFAKWNENISYYRTIYFNTSFGEKPENIVAIENTNISLPEFADVKITNENVTKTYRFLGWYLDQNFAEKFTQTTMPESDTILYAKWELISTETTVNIKIIDNGQTVFEDNLVAGTTLELDESVMKNENTKFYLDQGFTQEYAFDGTVPEENTTLYVRNQYALTVISEYGNITNSTSLVYQGADITSLLPKQNSYYANLSGYDLEANFVKYDYESSTMPNTDLVITAQWNTTEWVTLSFVTEYVRPTGWLSDGSVLQEPTSVAPIEVERNSTVDMTQFNSTMRYRYGWSIFSANYDFNIAYWSTTAVGTVASTPGINSSYDKVKQMSFNSHTTLYSVWKYA